jgi:GMP synthase-like glutamine amidotransferase
MEKHVLIVNMMLDPAMGDPVAQWSRYFRGVPYTSIHVPSGEAIPDFAEVTHVLLTGSEASTLDPQPWMTVVAERIREAAELGLPILGNCFGHQMIVWSLSGPAFTRHAPRPEVGWIEATIYEDDPLLAGVPRFWHAFALHLDEVCDLPSPWRTLAGNEACAHQAIRFGESPIWGIQPHPEATPEEAKRLLEVVRPLVAREMSQYLPQLLRAIGQRPRDDRAAQTIVDNFLSASDRRST